MHALLAYTLDRKSIPLEKRASVSAALERIRTHCTDQPIDNLVVLSTCERFEMYALPGNAINEHLRELSATHPFINEGVWYEEMDAAHHIFRVASGLESRLPGEPHVLGQVRDAYKAARRTGRSSGDFARLFEAALRCGRRVRRQTALGQVNTTYARLAADYLFDRLGLLRHRSLGIIGTGSLARDAATALRERGAEHLTFIGRHSDRTRTTAGQFGASWSTLDELNTAAPALDAIVCAAGSSQPIVEHAHVQHCDNVILVDLGMPPNAQIDLEQHHSGVELRRLDDFRVTDDVHAAIAEAEAVVDYALARFLQGISHMHQPNIERSWQESVV